MHMADALLSPVVGGIFWVVSAGGVAVAAKKITSENDIAKTPLMGVMGAFIFAAQMINFAIPGTGSSGHIGGGLLLTVLLGPWRAFLTLASVLFVQCLFFADGGLLALGCNIFNLAFFPAFIAYPYIYRAVAQDGSSKMRLIAGSTLAAVAGLQLGAFSVVIETTLSGSSELPFTTFALFMQPIHFAIGIVEGIITWAVLSFIRKVQPALLSGEPVRSLSRPLPIIITIAALGIGGLLSYAASSHPDGLEWAIGKVPPSAEMSVAPVKNRQSILEKIQHTTALMPDYTIPNGSNESQMHPLGTSAAGIIGSLLVLICALVIGIIARRRTTRTTR